jgi:TonB family protein
VLLAISGVVSIYAYDAHLEDQTYEAVITMVPTEAVVKAPATNPAKPRTADNNKSNIPERAIAMSRVDVPQVIPTTVSTTPNKVLPLPEGPVRITGRDWNPQVASGPTGPSTFGVTNTKPPTIILDEELPPQPPPAQPPAKKTILSKGVINGEAVYLPKPIYPAPARIIRLQGQVTVQVLIDEGGKVISAQPVAGHPFFLPEAKKAALAARFKPTLLSNQPVKVSGVITYNFVMQ